MPSAAPSEQRSDPAPSEAARVDERPLALEIRDLSKRYGPHWALVRLNFDLSQGRSLLLTGHNGSGKTTLLRLLATALRPSFGTLRILGLDASVERDAIRREIGLLSHSSFLYEDLSAEQNLVLLARLLGHPSPRDAAGELLTRVGLSRRSGSPVRQFSAGMRKRLAIARLLLQAPRLALLDEPFGELDPAGIAQMERIVGALKEAGTTLVLATHLVEQGEALCDSRLHLAQGRKVEA